MPFFGSKKEIADNAHDPGIDMWLGPAFLAGLSIGIGLLPNAVASLWVTPAVSAVTREAITVELALMHGLTPAIAAQCGHLLYRRGIVCPAKETAFICRPFFTLLEVGAVQGLWYGL